MSESKDELRQVIEVLRAANAAVPAGSTLTEAKSALGELIKKEAEEPDAGAEELALLVDVAVEAAQLVATLVLAASLAMSPKVPIAQPDTVPVLPPAPDEGTPVAVLPSETPAVPVAEDAAPVTP